MGKYRILIIGVGSIGERHLRCFGATGRAELGFCEINAALGETIAQRYPFATRFTDLASATRESWDAAVIATPANTHISIARELIEKGLHLLIEKPLSTTLEGLDDLNALALAKRRKVGIAYVHRANPILAQMREAILSGRFGKPLQLVAVCGQHFPTFRPAYREIYYTDRKRGGGAIQDALTHIINLSEWIVGPADRVVADAQHMGLPGITVEDTVHVLARHGAVMGCYSLNQFQQPNDLHVTIVCERGTARYEPMNHRWRWMSEPNSEWHDEAFAPAERDALFISQANAFMDALDGKSEVLCSLDEGIQTLKVNLALLEAADRIPWHKV